MKLASNIGWTIFGLVYMPWVWAEAIRLLAPKYHARILKRIKEGRI